MANHYPPVDRRSLSEASSIAREDISRLNLPSLTHNALMRAGFCSVELIRRSSDRCLLANVDCLGTKGLRLIRESIERMDLRLIRESIERMDLAALALVAEDLPEEPTELW